MLTSASGILGVRDAEDRRPDPRQRRRPRRGAARRSSTPTFPRSGRTSRRRSSTRTTASTSGSTRATRSPTSGSTPSPGKPPEEYNIEPTSLRHDPQGVLGHPRARQRHEPQRRARLDVLPELRAVLRPAVLASRRTSTWALNLLRAYNDWHIDEWCGTYPGRFIPLSIPPIWDPQLMADEVRRVAKKGCHAVTFSENPAKLGWPHIFGDHWDPFFAGVRGRGHGHLPAHRVVVDDARDSSRARRST